MDGRSVIAIVGAVCLLGGCGLPSMIEGQKITYTGYAEVPLQEAADCSYLAISKGRSSSIRKTDLLSQGVVHVEYVPDGFRFWRYTFTSLSKSKTKAEIESFRSAVPGDTGMVDPLRSCGFT